MTQAFVPPSPLFDVICNMLDDKVKMMSNCDRINHKHILRLASLIVLTADNDDEARSIVREMTIVPFGNAVLDCKTKKWEVVH